MIFIRFYDNFYLAFKIYLFICYIQYSLQSIQIFRFCHFHFLWAVSSFTFSECACVVVTVCVCVFFFFISFLFFKLMCILMRYGIICNYSVFHTCIQYHYHSITILLILYMQQRDSDSIRTQVSFSSLITK